MEKGRGDAAAATWGFRGTGPTSATTQVLKCKELNRAMRIGTNHGSLAARILSFYGDSPRGMVESALEFADVCRMQGRRAVTKRRGAFKMCAAWSGVTSRRNFGEMQVRSRGDESRRRRGCNVDMP